MHSTTQHSSAQLARQCALQPAAAVGPRAHSPAATVVPVAACCLHRHQRACIVGMRHAAWVGTRQPAVRLRHTEPSRLVELLPMPPLTCSSPCPSHAPQDWRQYPSLLSSPTMYAGLQQGRRCVCSVCCLDAKSHARQAVQAPGSVCTLSHAPVVALAHTGPVFTVLVVVCTFQLGAAAASRVVVAHAARFLAVAGGVGGAEHPVGAAQHSTAQHSTAQHSTVSIMCCVVSSAQHSSAASKQARAGQGSKATHSDWQYFCLAQAGHWA